MSSKPPGLLSDEILSKGEGVNYICLIKIGIKCCPAFQMSLTQQMKPPAQFTLIDKIFSKVLL